jgi:hypothetical protein
MQTAQLIAELNFTRNVFKKHLFEFHYSSIIIQNGRWRSQNVIRVLSEGKADIYFLQSGGGGKEWIYCGKAMVQDKYPFQSECIKQYEKSGRKLSQSTTRDFSSEWAIKMQTRSARFYRQTFETWTNKRIDQNLRKIPLRNYSLLLTSTTSEYDHISDTKFEWKNQADAFLQVARELKKRGQTVVLRFHPNQLNYAWLDFHEIFVATKNFVDLFIFPWESFSTYKLIENANEIIVWESSAGFEAALRDKKVTSLIDTYYSYIGNVPCSLNMTEFVSWLDYAKYNYDKVRATYILNYFGTPMRLENFHDIDQLRNSIKKVAKRQNTNRGRISSWIMVLRRIRFGKAWYLFTPLELISFSKAFLGLNLTQHLINVLIKVPTRTSLEIGLKSEH